MSLEDRNDGQEQGGRRGFREFRAEALGLDARVYDQSFLAEEASARGAEVSAGDVVGNGQVRSSVIHL